MYLEKEAGKGATNENEASAKVLTSLAGPKAAWWILKVFFLSYVHASSDSSHFRVEVETKISLCCYHVQPRVFLE